MSEILPRLLPEDINAEILLSYFPEGRAKVAVEGSHGRNAYRDVLSVEKFADGSFLLRLGRKSLYNALPEYMFHPIDRFENISGKEHGEEFAEESKNLKTEKDNALRFFAPFDVGLLDLRCKVRDKIQGRVSENTLLQEILTDTLTEKQRSNRFIRRVLPLMPSCRYIRGDRTFLTLMLRKVFMEEGIGISVHERTDDYADEQPRYATGIGARAGACYAGNQYSEAVTVYDVRYWPSEEGSEAQFKVFLEEIEAFRRFIQDYFLSVEEALQFEIINEREPAVLSKDGQGAYLNHNANIL